MNLLLAEDETELAESLSAYLSRSNYTVEWVDNGRDALEYIELGEYDCAILDVMMPQMDGFSVVRELRAKGNRIPILILTAKAGLEDRVMGLDMGADDYLAKPFAMKELLARLRAITRRGTEVSSAKLTLGNVTLDSASCILSTPKENLRLTGKEYQMMELLLSHPNQVFPSERLKERIWGYENEAEINVVWVTVSSLRKRLKQLHADIQIKAARGQGYYVRTLDGEEK